MPRTFEDRRAAGVRLAEALKQHRGHAVALAVGVEAAPVAAEVSRLLYLPLGIIPVRRLTSLDGVTFGVLALDGAAAVDWPLLGRVGEAAARAVVTREQHELARLETVFAAFLRPPVERRTVILIGDAIETGMRMRAALRALRGGRPSRVIAAAPVGRAEAMQAVAEEVAQCVCAVTAAGFHPRGEWYAGNRIPSEAEALGRLETQARHARLTVA
jgi:putative phosphoribosyl transferase